MNLYKYRKKNTHIIQFRDQSVCGGLCGDESQHLEEVVFLADVLQCTSSRTRSNRE